MDDKIEFGDRPILTPADELESKAYDILGNVVYRPSSYAEELEVLPGQLLVKAVKMRLVTK